MEWKTEYRQDYWVHLGKDCWARLSEIVAVHNGNGANEYAVAPLAGVRSCVLLRSGDLLPAYVSAKTLVEHMTKEASDASR